jgi:hypothetical protein
MEPKSISRHIAGCINDIVSLENNVNSMVSAVYQRRADEYENLSIGAALQAEYIACRLRHLVYQSTTVKRADYLEKAAEAQGNKISYWGGVMEITLPVLLPKRKWRQNTEFLSGPLHFAFSHFADGHKMPHFAESAVCFMYIYDRSKPTRRVRDYDNLECKQVLDVINSFVLADDTGLLCDVFHTTTLGESDCTKVFVMDRAGFPKWLSEKDF